MKPPRREASVTVDVTTAADYPLSKSKFALFNSGLVPLSTYRRDGWAIQAVKPESVRIDIGWGAEWMNWSSDVVRTGTEGPIYNFTELNDIARSLVQLGVRPYLAYCYVPSLHRPEDGDWRTFASDDAPWIEMVATFVEQARTSGLSIGYHEVYNEPDLRDERTGEPVFYTGDLEDYLNLYTACALAIRSVDPLTPVGGPALASTAANHHWIPAFLDRVESHHLPLDFFSFHHYGTNSVHGAIDRVFEYLAARPATAEVETHLNEYNSFAVDYPRGGLQDSHYMASALLKDFHDMLARPGLTRIHWAQFLDSGNDNYSGMVTVHGNTKPAYHAYQLYQHMPTDRVATDVDGSDIYALASSEPGRTEVLIFSRAGHANTVTVHLPNLPATVHAVEVLTLDENHLIPTAQLATVHDERILVDLAAAGFAMVRAITGTPAARPPGIGDTVRTRYSYPDRWTTAWADIQESDTTVRFGSGKSPDTVPTATLVVTPHHAVIAIDATIHRNGQDSDDTSTTVSIRISDGDHCLQVNLGPGAPAPQRWPSWAASPPSHTLNQPHKTARIDTAAFGLAGAQLSITAVLHTAEEGVFATLRLQPA